MKGLKNDLSFKKILHIGIITIFVLVITIALLILSTKITSHVDLLSNDRSRSANHYSILIILDENRLYILNNGKPFKNYPCASGKEDTPSPTGNFKIIEKSHWGEGFGGYWLGINCPWGNYGIHGTTDPGSIGYYESHGCIRMYSEDCREVYELVPLYTQVVIAAGCYGPFTYGFRSIVPHSIGEDVLAVQKRLRDLGYYKGLCNGQYDVYGFKAAIHMFQEDSGLPISDTITKKMAEAMGFVFME